jgi:type IV pilus assembly protein PilV
MKATRTSRQQQTGAYLLEALIGILIFALGILGIVGLQAASLKTTKDSSLRAEAVFAANQLLGQMWADDWQSLDANYSSIVGTGQPYKDFAAQLMVTQGGTWVQDPIVQIDPFGAPPSRTSGTVTIQIFWQSDTGEPLCGPSKKIPCHSYTTSGVIGQNF